MGLSTDPLRSFACFCRSRPLCGLTSIPVVDPHRQQLAEAHLSDETAAITALLDEASFDAPARERIAARAARLVEAVRAHPHPFDSFLHEYDLSSVEGVQLMCLAEALLRIPDAATADRLIQDKLGGARWDRHLGHSGSLLVNASTWGLMFTGRWLEVPAEVGSPTGLLTRLVARSGESTVRRAMVAAMHLIARQFVMGRDMAEALDRAAEPDNRRYRYSFDRLGEAAVTGADAERYFRAYSEAVETVAKRIVPTQPLHERPGISVKLSALHPRYEPLKRQRVLAELTPRLLALARKARWSGVPLTIDAEEARRLELSLDLFERVFNDPILADWEGFGLAVQAYQKRAPALLDWLADLAGKAGRRIPVRLVKGAYWDTEIKAAQQQGLPGYPVYTRKLATDIAWLASARRLLEAGDCFHPQFATHNAHGIAAVLELAGARRDFEFQRLHGMGMALYDAAMADWNVACRVYAPVGGHRDLLPYLVRRLLENGANSSFVNRIVDRRLPIDELTADPVEQARGEPSRLTPGLPLPLEIYPDRRNSEGLAFDNPRALESLRQAVADAGRERWFAGPLVDGRQLEGSGRDVTAAAARSLPVGRVIEANAAAAEQAMNHAAAFWPEWNRLAVDARAQCLEQAADAMEAKRDALIARIVVEGGRTLPDALDEVREAADFCRYYALVARGELGERELPGPTGERNVLRGEGRGVFVCISPWNFPVSIFTGQIVAALVAGNTVVAKPAHQTPLSAMAIVEHLHAAGIPGGALHFLPGPGGVLGKTLLNHPALAGVAFTGSTATGGHLQRTLAARDGPLLPLIAETGGQNALIVDSSALPEQVVGDIIRSAFDSAGQRCSALRVLFVQESVADRLLELLTGAMAELQVGDPLDPATDVGPVIDAEALAKLEAHIARMKQEATLLAETPLPAGLDGCFVAPIAFEIDRLDRLPGEVFGPVLHVIRYKADQLDAVIAAVNATGYGLTLGIHSRIEATVRYITDRVRVGNVYINRDMVGAVVGVQPFGGRGLSGTGPKAGGPHYLLRFATEKTITTNTAAVGGNPDLLRGE